MKKWRLNKKVYLITAAVVFLFFLIFYLKTTAVNPVRIFNKINQSSSELLLAEKDEEKITPAVSENKSLDKNIHKKEEEIENIALVEEIKDPFVPAQKSKINKLSDSKKKSIKGGLNLNEDQDLILLEKNIISETINKTENTAEQMITTKAETLPIKKEDAAENEKEEAERAAELNNQNKNKFPFELLGIIKNKANAAALFSYQGRNILKKEKEKIDVYQVKKINKNEIILTYQKKELKQQLWEVKENEN